MADGDTNIKVVVRCRPLNTRELARGAKNLIRMHANQTFLDPPDHPSPQDSKRATERKTMSFSFDKSYWSAGPRDDPLYCSQQTLYDDLGKELLDHGFAGFNACILAYGQTGAHPSQKPKKPHLHRPRKVLASPIDGPDKGIIPLTCSELFQRVRVKSHQDPTVHFTVEVAYIEIYNEKVRDLLNPKNTGNLRVREHPSLGPYVEDLSKLVVTSYDEMMTLMDEGNKARTVAATNMNETSSRSHAVFTLLLTMKRHDTDTNLDTEKVSRISLVDLAGSERANSTGATGQRLKEGANINKSLTTLGKVISALAAQSSTDHPAKKGKKGKAEEFIPYRDSVLTWLLKDSLGGNSKTAMIAAISPADYEETLSTLRYADQAKKIKNKAVVNEDPNAKLVRELKEELEMLRARVAGSSGEEMYDPKIPASRQIVTYQTKDGTIKKVTKAELQEQMETREKLMNELNETWEDKLHRTQEVQKERERALEELGITVEKNLVGVHTPKKMPHLVNLNEDPLMSECLIYQIKPGKTVVGRMDSEKPAAIRLSGDKILEEHCHFDNVDGKVTIQGMPDSITFLNGKQIASGQSYKLRSGFRIILGDNHVFRFNNPEEVRKKRDRATAKSSLHMSISVADSGAGVVESSPRPVSTIVSSDDEGQADVDWTFAQREAAFARLGLDPSLDNLADDDLNKLFEKITRVKTLRDTNSKGRPESSLSHADDIWSEGGGRGADFRSSGEALMDETSPWAMMEESSLTTTQIREVQQPRLREMEDGSLETEDLIAEKEHVEHQLRLVRERMKRIIDARARGEPDLESIGVGNDGHELVIYSARQLRLIRKVLDKWRAHRSFSMAETILTNAVVVKEANVISNELGKRVSYNFAIASGGSLAVPTSAVDSITGLDQFGDVADPILRSNTQPSVAIKVIDYKHNAIYVWSLDRLQQQLQRMRNLTTFIDRPLYTQHFSSDEPFYDSPPPEYSFIGNALISLAPLLKRLSSRLIVPIFCRYSAEAIGSCRVEIKLVGLQVPMKYGNENESLVGASMRAGTPVPGTIPVGTKLSFVLTVDCVKGFLSHDFSAVHLQVRLSSLVGGTVTTMTTTTTMEKGISEEVFPSTVVEMEHGSLSDLKFQRSFNVVASSKVVNHFRHGYAPIEFFASLKPMYLERMERWDEMREQKRKKDDGSSSLSSSTSASTSSPSESSSGSSSGSHLSVVSSDSQASSPGTTVTSTTTAIATAGVSATASTGGISQPVMRRSENDFVVAQTHDVVVWMQICELGLDGKYVGVPVISQGSVDPGAFSIHQGLQRRIVVELSSNSGQQLPWREVTKMKIGNVRILDLKSHVIRESSSKAFVTLALQKEQRLEFRPDGTGLLRAEGLWDSSLHDSELLNCVTGSNRRVVLRIVWGVDVEICEEPVEFGMDVGVVVCARDATRPSSRSSSSSGFLTFFGGSIRVLAKTSTLFNVKLTPPLTRSVNDLWRLDTSEKYVRGEEILGICSWKPRSLTVVEDYERLVMTERRSADVQAMRVIVMASAVSRQVYRPHDDDACFSVWRAEDILRRMIQLWQKRLGYRAKIVLSQDSDTEQMIKRKKNRDRYVKYVSETRVVSRVDTATTKKGHLLILIDANQNTWEKRWFVLRRPYLHMYAHSNELEELGIISLSGVNVQNDPLKESLLGKLNSFTLFTASNSHAFAAPNLKELQSWTTKLDPTRLSAA